MKMRFLNKIVFINSAHIRYAEVSVDGNVHFTGTQGVGKTTLLRALLFFYNCRKDRLGIRSNGQQDFDTFYIPTLSSYIIYEVSRGDDEPPFSIILFRHYNRAAFRFVDAPYSSDWFIDQYGIVASDQLKVRDRLQKQGIDFSPIIERYTNYLDILYGNRNTQSSKDLLKYYLLKSQQYQNIPRIIQNVFLNDRVDAAFIKDIIISSVTGEDEDIAVDLNFFRSKLIHFSDEVRDISLWTNTNRQGVIETRRDADIIIKISHDIKAVKFSLREQCGMLNYALNKAEREIPILFTKITKHEDDLKKIDTELLQLAYKYDIEKRKIEDRIAVLSSDLKRASQLKKKYESLGISMMLERSQNLEGFRMELIQKERFLNQLTSEHQSIAAKFSMARERLTLDQQLYRQDQLDRKNQLSADFNDRESARLRHLTNIEAEIRQKRKSLLADINDSVASHTELLQELKIQKVKIAQYSPRKKELDECRNNINESQRKINRLNTEILKKENILDSLQKEIELICSEIEADVALQIKDIERSVENLEDQRKNEQSILERTDGSLCEWLDDNIVGWEYTIGKVVDEKEVLYAQNLNPRISNDSSESLFGIDIDLDSINREVRTPAMIKETISIIENNINAFQNSIIRLREAQENNTAQATKEIRAKIRSTKADIDTIKQDTQICRQQSNTESLRLSQIEEEEERERQDKISSLNEQIQECELTIRTLTTEREAIEEQCERELRRRSKIIKNEANSDRTETDTSLKAIDDDIARYAADITNRLQQLAEEEGAELSGAGADINMIDQLKSEIQILKDSLAQIDRERDTIAEYRKDCRELFDAVPQMQVDKKNLEAERDNLQQKYRDRRQKDELKKRETEQSLSDVRSIYSRTLESKKAAEDFIASKACPSELIEIGGIQTDLDCKVIISTIHSLIVDIHQLSDSLKTNINEFRKRFSSENTFKFPTIFDTIDDYHHYADSLEDFIENNKIEDFQKVSSNLYRDILSRAAADYNILLGRESEIMRIIRDINYDFEKKTFAGVIRRIELRLERSSMPIIAQLQNITDFWNTHQYELGEVNLFSTDDHLSVNKESIKYLKSLSAALNNASELKKLPLAHTFTLKFRIQENDNITDWVENIRTIGSEGTDILVKAIINILLISVFKRRVGQATDFRLHCMMDEIGRLADENIHGILNFANQRGIYIVNSSPKAHRPLSYRRLYMLSKDNEANTMVQPILSIRESELL